MFSFAGLLVHGFYNTAFVGLGTNIGPRLSYLSKAKNYLDTQCGAVVSASSILESEAWGNTAQPAFLNQVLLLRTPLTPLLLLKKMQQIERQLGRERKEKWGPRTIDLDLLLYNSLELQHPNLTIPHPWIAERKFVLFHLNELIPNLAHPTLEKTFRTLYNECADKSKVKVYATHF